MIGDLEPFWLSIRVATVSTVIIIGLGVPMAMILARGHFRGREFLAGLLLLPLVIPPTVLGYVLLWLLGRQGVVGHWLESTWGLTIVFHWSGAVVASTVTAFPLFLIPARAALEEVDPALEATARLLGRGEWSVFWTITVPLAWRGLVSGAVLAFARALGDFGATLMVAGNIPGRTQTAALAIFDAVNVDNLGRAGELSILVALVSLVAVVIAQTTGPRSRRR
jgi:molybdate transport system permease protein